MINRRKDAKDKVLNLKEKLGMAGALLLEIADTVEWVFSRPYNVDFSEYQDRKYRQQLKEQRQYLYYLRQKKYIETKKIGEKLVVRLTEQGWQKAIRDKIRSTKDKCKNGLGYFVIFDIPEKERNTRNVIRNFLKECGFKRIQHSIWMTDCEVLDPLNRLLKGRDIAKWVRIISGRIISTSLLDRID